MTSCGETAEERWAAIDGFPMYEVSDAGRVRSFMGRNGKRRAQPIIMRPNPCGRYAAVSLGDNGTRCTAHIHRLVLKAFGGEQPPGMQACHANGNARDNRASNLRWGSPLDNAADRLRHGTQARGTKHGAHRSPWAVLRGEAVGTSKLTAAQARAIYEASGRQRDIARTFGVSQRLVGNIKRREAWAHIHREVDNETL